MTLTNFILKRSKWIIILFCLLMIYIWRNHIRVSLFERCQIQSTTITIKNKIDEGWFIAEIYDIDRIFSNSGVSWCNKLIHDQLFVATIPIKKIRVKNLILKPIGEDEISDLSDFYFNTVFFTKDFTPTKSYIHNNRQISQQKEFCRTGIGIDKDGHLHSLYRDNHNAYKDAFEAPFVIGINTEGNDNFNRINYRQFITIKEGNLIYVSGKGNSLICKQDVQALMGEKISRP